MVRTFHKHCDSGLYTLKTHVLDHIVEDIWRIGTLSAMNTGPYAHFNVHIKYGYKGALQGGGTKMMEMIVVFGTSYKGAIPYRKKEDVGKFE